MSDKQGGILARISVPTADIADNINTRDVVGNKEDALVSAVGTTKSLMAYIKGLIQREAQLAVPKTGYKSGDGDCVNITDKGVLTGVSLFMRGEATGTPIVTLAITIDGTSILNSVVMKMYGEGTGSISIPFNHRFNTSLRVAFSHSGTLNELYCVSSYTTD